MSGATIRGKSPRIALRTSATTKASTTSALAPIVPLQPSLEASDSRLQFHPSRFNYPQPCLPRSPPPPPPPRRVPPPLPLMAPTLVRLPRRHAVATRARVLHRVRSPLLTLCDRYGKGCYHQGESMFSGASLPPHLCLRANPPTQARGTVKPVCPQCFGECVD